MAGRPHYRVSVLPYSSPQTGLSFSPLHLQPRTGGEGAFHLLSPTEAAGPSQCQGWLHPLQLCPETLAACRSPWVAWPKLPHPMAGAQDWRLQGVGPVWPHHRGGGKSVADEGLFLSL